MSPHVRFLLLYWPSLLAFLVVLRFFLAATEPLVPMNNVWQKNRINQGLAGLREIEPGPGQVLMLGASEALLGFQPSLFERLAAERGKKAISYNFSFQNTGTMVPLYLARVKRELERAGKKASVILLALPPARLTVRARQTFFSQARYHDIDAVFFEPGLWRELDDTLPNKFILLFNKWVLGERSLVQLQRTFVQLSHQLLPMSNPLRASADPFYRDEIHPEPAWDSSRRGGYYLNIEARPDLAGELMAAARQPAAMAADLRDLVRCCDVLELNFDEEYLSEIGAALRELKAVTDHVALVTYPENPALKRAPAAAARSRAALDKIAREGEVEVWDSGASVAFSEGDYFDHSHFTPDGLRKHLAYLAERMPSSWVAGGAP